MSKLFMLSVISYTFEVLENTGNSAVPSLN